MYTMYILCIFDIKGYPCRMCTCVLLIYNTIQVFKNKKSYVLLISKNFDLEEKQR